MIALDRREGEHEGAFRKGDGMLDKLNAWVERRRAIFAVGWSVVSALIGGTVAALAMLGFSEGRTPGQNIQRAFALNAQTAAASLAGDSTLSARVDSLAVALLVHRATSDTTHSAFASTLVLVRISFCQDHTDQATRALARALASLDCSSVLGDLR